jgi:hypothetical protein
MRNNDPDDQVLPLTALGGTALRIHALAKAAYRRVRAKRLEMFFENIGRFSDPMTDRQREQFEAVIRSDEGQAFLTDLAERAARTRSFVAIAALAIL